MNFFVWEALKQKVYSLPVKKTIERPNCDCSAQISYQYLAAIQTVHTKCNVCIVARDQHFEQYLH